MKLSFDESDSIEIGSGELLFNFTNALSKSVS